MITVLFLALGTGCIWVGWSSFRENEIPLKFDNKITRAENPLLFATLCLVFLLVGCLFLLGAVGLTLRSTRTPPALSSALSLRYASSAPFIASAQAGPVSFIR
jgi:hypothetical protein